MLKYELVITVWDDDLYKGNFRIVSDDSDLLLELAEEKLKKLNESITEENRRRYVIAEDDDIPF